MEKIGHNFRSIAEKFYPESSYHSCEPYGSGHIHETFLLIKSSGGHLYKFILQRFNNSVFREPEKVMNNIRKITSHLKDFGGKNSDTLYLSMVPSLNNEYWYQDEMKNYWRCFDFIEGSYTIDRVENGSQAFEGARMFGNFFLSLSDIDPKTLDITIPDFHNIVKRLEALEQAVGSGGEKRRLAASAEISQALGYNQLVKEFLFILPEIPVRATHNDTKINNVLFSSSSGKGICVIDLDTVMPGTVLSDFGDMVRTFTNSGDEDEKDLRKVFFRPEIFREMTRGFIEGVQGILRPVEKYSLVLGGQLIIYMQAIRFLTDYLNGDTYYKIEYPEHNLVRTRNQLKLLDSFLEYEEEAKHFLLHI
jgi:Phosphotransferase enzyme family